MTLATHNVISVPEAAARLGVGRVAVGNAIREGRLRAQRLGRKAYVIEETDLESYRRTHSFERIRNRRVM